LEDFKARAIKRAERDYTPKLEVEMRGRVRAEEKLEKVRNLVRERSFEMLKELVEKGEV
jgi:hypothetical protein